MKLWVTACVGGLLIGGAPVAMAQVAGTPSPLTGAGTKAGVDAWAQGDYTKATSIWRPLANAGEADAQFNMGQAYKLGRGVPTDIPMALNWFRKAADQGHLRAEDNYGLLLFQQNRRAEAMPYLQKSAARGDGRAQYFLGTALYNGDGIEKDWVQAYALMTRSAASGLPAASASLATMDQYIPEAQRKQGLSIAAKMGDGSGSTAVAVAAAPPPYASPTSSVRTTTLPPSTIGAPPPPRAVAGQASAPLPTRPMPIPPPAYHPDAPSTSTPAMNAPPPPAVYSVPPAVTPPRPAYAAPPATPPAYRPSAPLRPTAQQSGNWRIQLGAFSEEIRARNLWGQLSAKIPGLGALQPYLVKQANLTHLQAGPLASAGAAEQLCRSVKAAGSDCLVKSK